jgi:hypothetical protein
MAILKTVKDKTIHKVKGLPDAEPVKAFSKKFDICSGSKETCSHYDGLTCKRKLPVDPLMPRRHCHYR